MFDSYKDCLPEKYRKFPNFFRRSNTVFHARILYIKLTLSWFLSTTTVKNYFTIFLKSKVSEFLKTAFLWAETLQEQPGRDLSLWIFVSPGLNTSVFRTLSNISVEAFLWK